MQPWRLPPAVPRPLVDKFWTFAPWVKLNEVWFRGYRPKVRIDIKAGRFGVKTVTHWEELEAVLKLRHEVFHREHHGRTLPLGIDIDEIDFVCDHLIIQDLASDKVIGSYRLTSTLFSTVFYSQHRFHLSDFLAMPGEKLELGRACIDSSYRTGASLSLLWKGIGEYLKATDTKYLFGKVWGMPGLDPFMKSADFFTVLNRQASSARLERRYF